MSGIATAVIGGSIISGVVASKSAKKGAKAITESTATATEEQRRQFDVTQQSLQPFQRTGLDALEQQRILLGLGATDPNEERRADLQSQITSLQQNQVQQSQAQPVRPKDVSGGAFGTVLRRSQDEQATTTDSDISSLQAELDAIPEFSPGTAQEQQKAAFGALEESAGQKFLRERGQKELLRGAASIGGLGGGNVKKALVEFGIGTAQQDLQNRFGRLGQLAGQGQAAAKSAGQFGQAASTNISNLALSAGQARATGIAGRNEAIQSGIQGVTTGLSQSGVFNPSSGGQTLPASNIDPFARTA